MKDMVIFAKTESKYMLIHVQNKDKKMRTIGLRLSLQNKSPWRAIELPPCYKSSIFLHWYFRVRRLTLVYTINLNAFFSQWRFWNMYLDKCFKVLKKAKPKGKKRKSPAFMSYREVTYPREHMQWSRKPKFGVIKNQSFRHCIA